AVFTKEIRSKLTDFSQVTQFYKSHLKHNNCLILWVGWRRVPTVVRNRFLTTSDKSPSHSLHLRVCPRNGAHRLGGPLKPGFGLSGIVPQLHTAFPPLVRVSAPSIPTRSLRVLQRQLHSGESCSTATPPDERITRA